ncbi:MAG TPA: cytochrome c biogenesis protein CcsA [Candidatus Thermoplasmatota archaeon]|nr:cytochrome c biogenesis protein CcsA [Candidatus Thermoplasmatota archaeon]
MSAAGAVDPATAAALWDAAMWLACALAVGAAAAAARGRLGGWPGAHRSERLLLSAAAAIASLAFLWLLGRFVVADVTIQYVFLYTSTALPLHWRIAGTWAGREGSLLLWATLVTAVAALVCWRHARAGTGGVAGTGVGVGVPAVSADPAEERGRVWTRMFLALFAAAFLAAVAAQHTFAPTPDFFLQGRPGGNGLNPTLKSAFILIHPPLMFTAYALATVPAAAVLAHLATGTDRWGRIGLVWSRVDWLLYTFAMGLGGIWAYYTLGFGGYWAWDPVEVANLLPWLALTVFLHAQLHHARFGGYRVIGPFLGLLPFLLTVFSTISTRSGLWVSVHAFTDPTNTFDPDAPGRFLDILQVEQGLLVYLRLFLGTLGLGLALWCLRMARDHGTLRKASLAIAAVLAAVGTLGALAPHLTLALLFELAWRATGGRTGIGLLALLFLACIGAALPALMANEEGPARKRRLDLRTLAAYSVLVLGLSLLVLFLLHVASANGWDTGFYERRLPVLATPALLGLFVLQSHAIVGRRASVWLTLGVWAASGLASLAVPSHREGAYLLVLSAALVAVSLRRVRDAALVPGMGKAQRLGPSLLGLAGLLDLLFWLNPPSRIGWGAWTWHPVFPMQVLFGLAAAAVLWTSLRLLAGAAPRRTGWAFGLAALLGGFGVAPVLALAGWLALRRQPSTPGPVNHKAWARLRQAGLYGAHLAVAVTLLGYAPSTYWKESATLDLGIGDTVDVGGAHLRLTSIDIAAGGAFADAIHPRFERTDSPGSLSGILRWEPQVGAHFPLPATLRAWNGDVYVNVDSVHVAASRCSGERTIAAYEAANPPRACAGDTVDSVTIQATWLPGLGVVWTALALFVLSMLLILRADAVMGPDAAGSRQRAAAVAPADVADRSEVPGTGP